MHFRLWTVTVALPGNQRMRWLDGIPNSMDMSLTPPTIGALAHSLPLAFCLLMLGTLLPRADVQKRGQAALH